MIAAGLRRRARRRQGALAVIAWAVFLGLLAPPLWVMSPDRLAPALLTAAVAATLVLALCALPRPPGESPLGAPSVSPPSVATALGVAAIVLGTVFGSWLWAVGAGVTLLGLAGLVREWTAPLRRPG